MTNNQLIAAQEVIEDTFNRKHIDKKIRKVIESDYSMLKKITHGIDLITVYLSGFYYESKMKRIAQLNNIDIYGLVTEIFIGIAYFQKDELFTSVAAQIAARLKFSDRVEAITTTAELLAILCRTNAFDIDKKSKLASLTLVSKILLPEDLINFIAGSQYLPPMVCEPMELEHNFSSGYLTHNDSLLLGSGNHHDGDLCLDVLNVMGKVALKISVDFINSVDEEPTYELATPEQIELWDTHKNQCNRTYSLMIHYNNKFYFNHKVDKRGRIYSSGYHINPQGTSYKKAMLEFAKEELIQGVPDVSNI